MVIRSSDTAAIKPFLEKLFIPRDVSHKGQNGRVMVIGGSQLFHSASIWAAETASHFVDIVHYSSTQENNEVMLSLKKKFQNGIVVPQKDIPVYMDEDDAILIGPGMLRGDLGPERLIPIVKFEELLSMPEEQQFTYYLTRYLILHYPEKRFVFDAGAIQMMHPEWLQMLRQPPVVTPHQLEFEKLFGTAVLPMDLEEKRKLVEDTARKFKIIIMLKAVTDIISNGETTIMVEGGNQGLTKGGTGDILAGLTLSLFAKSPPLESAVLASYFLKRAADALSETKGYWYNNDDLIEMIPTILKKLLYN